MSIAYTLHSGKNNKFVYYTKAYARELTPKFLCQRRRESLLQALATRPDADYIKQRIDYYCRLNAPIALGSDSPTLGEHKCSTNKVYYFDSYEFTRYFPDHLRWRFLKGDITYVPDQPTVVKSRPLQCDNSNSVLLKLDKIRHFTFVNDRKPFATKRDQAIFRGKVAGKENRIRFMQMYFGSDICDCGNVSTSPDTPIAWHTPKKTIREHLDYKFVMALEGNDVASNLKWVMSSNSIAVMPRPTCETWFMEGTLIPNYHYIEIKPDFSDLGERLQYYAVHSDEAEQIITHAHAFVAQFRDKTREKLIALGVLDKYLKLVNNTK
ncbi:MAG: glycosyl transferase family 90 [Paludibacteraceae bacterium]